MQDMKKKKKRQQELGNEQDSKKKERHIVSWTQEEDGILREQISIHGTENWAIIASKFKDKTTRQCRRRWYTYLNSDFKKGGWTEEEDMLLCEAQKIFGNRWTEIAKVVSGRTDNAVKNRFSTLCKKRAKYEAMAKENNTSYININNKRIINSNTECGNPETGAPLKRMRRTHIPEVAENIDSGDRLHKKIHQQPRTPFAVLVQNFHYINNLSVHHDEYHNDNIRGMLLQKDGRNTDGYLEHAWKILQDFLNQSKGTDCQRQKTHLQLEDLSDMVEDIRSSDEGSRPSWRAPDLYENSPGSSEYSTGSTIMQNSAGDKLEQSVHQDIGIHLKSTDFQGQKEVDECEKVFFCKETVNQDIFLSCEEGTSNDGIVSASSSTEFSSPLQVTPLFRSLAAAIPSPKFSESERNFLMKTLGMESPSTNPSGNVSQTPACKRALHHSL